MPPSVRDWLAQDHLAWFVLDSVAELDLSGFYARYRPDGRGGAAYEPAVMVAVVVYGYCVGDRSSRVIERRLREDVAYRVVAANATPDHATIARFRADNDAALGELFVQVLSLCATAGMVRVGLVALDGTKIGADAALAANMSEDRLRKALEAEVRRILDEAAAIDAAEDELYGDARGDELPPELADRSERLKRLRAAREQLDAAAAKRDKDTPGAARNAERSSQGRPRRGRPAKNDPAQKPLLANATDPESRVMKTQGGFCQGYNAQAVATEDQIIVAAEVSQDAADVGQLAPMLAAAVANLAAADVAESIGVAVADAGYYSTANAELEAGIDLLIATSKARNLPTTPPDTIDPDAETGSDVAERTSSAATRAAVLDRHEAGEITIKQVAAELGLSVARVYQLRDAYRRLGIDGLPQAPARAKPRNDPPAIAKNRMQAKLASDQGRSLYKRRGQIIEPVFGQIKDPRGIRRFQRRGLAACAAEWKLIAATHNLLKLWRRQTATRLALTG